MNRTATTPLLALALVASAAASAVAAVPSAANSTLPPCMVLCPMGDLPFIVVVRDFANNPIAGSTVVLDFSDCPNGAYICPQPPPDPYAVNYVARTLSRLTDGAGRATFVARLGGTGPAGCVSVSADGVVLRTYALASPDQDGDGQVVSVIGTDDPRFAAKLGSSDPTADFDCDGYVDSYDEQIFFYHHSHACEGFVDPVRHRSWGSLKLHYR